MPIDWIQIVELGAIFGAGFLAGGINVIVGAGTLVSFPILVFLGLPPLTATIANTIGIVPGSISGVVAYKRELLAHVKTIRFLLPASIIGGITGASLLLHFSADVFTAVIPWLIGFGTLLVIAGPSIKKHVGAHTSDGVSAGFRELPFPSRTTFIVSVCGALLLGIYGGYFSAAQGILLIALLGITSTLQMKELNAIKNLTVAAVNLIAASVFVIVSPELISWSTVALIALGSALGGYIGGRYARRLRPSVFRAFVVIVGITTIFVMTIG